MTNADKVRKMSNEELALVIMCPYSISEELCSRSEEPGCIECCKKWLESDAEDEEI